MKQIVEPMFEAKDDFDIFRELCSRFGREEAFTGGKTKMEWIEEIYNGARLQGRGIGVRMPNFVKFWEEEQFIAFPEGTEWVRHSAFRKEPDLEPLGTATGLIEIYCKTIADMGYDDCQGHPMWFEKVERSTVVLSRTSTRCTCKAVTRITVCTRSCVHLTTSAVLTLLLAASLATSALQTQQRVASSLAIWYACLTTVVRYWQVQS